MIFLYCSNINVIKLRLVSNDTNKKTYYIYIYIYIYSLVFNLAHRSWYCVEMIGFANFLIFCAAIAYNNTASTRAEEKAVLKQLILMYVGSINIHVKLQSGF